MQGGRLARIIKLNDLIEKNKFMFTSNQLKQLSDRGISLEQALAQLEIFRKGIEPVRLVRPAIPNDGIEVFETEKIDHYASLFEKEKQNISLLKFVPASGAASRMFKQLFEALNEFITNPDNAGPTFQKMPEIWHFFKDIRNYPFYDDLVEVCSLRYESGGTNTCRELRGTSYYATDR